jgi:hypothetical protein
MTDHGFSHSTYLCDLTRHKIYDFPHFATICTVSDTYYYYYYYHHLRRRHHQYYYYIIDKGIG